MQDSPTRPGNGRARSISGATVFKRVGAFDAHAELLRNEPKVLRNERGEVRSVRFDEGLTGAVRGAWQLEEIVIDG